MKKRALTVIVSFLFVCTLVAGCMKEKPVSDQEEKTPIELDGDYTIGILQYAEHGAFETCKEGFLNQLNQEGFVEGSNLTIAVQNAGANPERAKLIASSFVSQKLDLIYCIGTTSAQMLLNETRDTDIPMVFAAVTDPVSAELADTDGVQYGETTGVSNEPRPDEELNLIQEILPKAKRIGILYSDKDVNSLVTVEAYRSCIQNYDMQLVLKPMSSNQEFEQLSDEMINESDCIINIEDSTATTLLNKIINKANKKQIPVFGNESGQVKMGCLAASGVDYNKAGALAGEKASSILKKDKMASEIPISEYHTLHTYLNLSVAENLGIEISEEIVDQMDETFDEITEQGEKE